MHNSRTRYSQQSGRVTSEETSGSSGIACSLLVSEADEANAFCLCPNSSRYANVVTSVYRDNMLSLTWGIIRHGRYDNR